MELQFSDLQKEPKKQSEVYFRKDLLWLLEKALGIYRKAINPGDMIIKSR